MSDSGIEARRRSFDAAAERYDAVRPSYPDAFADLVLAAAGRRVLEIGAGTGKATVVFARRGASMVALEPGANLAAVLRRNVAGHDVTVVETTFEDWPVTRAFDVVMAAQALHWIDPRVRYPKIAEVLAPGGALAVLRNEKAPFPPALRSDLDAAYAEWHTHAGERAPPATIQATIDQARDELVGEIDASLRFGPVEVTVHPWSETFTTARYLALLDTYSDHAVLVPDRRAGLYRAIAAAIDRQGGSLEVGYLSMAFVARRR